MGAAPSALPGHDLAPATDIQGDDFPSGASFYLLNGASGYTDCLAIDPNGQAKLKTIRDSPDRKWLVEYAWGDRRKVALKNVGSKTWLMPKDATYGSKTSMYGGQIYWYVYKTEDSNSFWLSTTRFPDCFLCCLDDPATPGTDVVNLTNKHGAGAGKGPELFEGLKAELSWRLEWTPEYEKQREATPEGKAAIEKRRAQSKPAAEQESIVCCERCGEKCKMYQEAFAEVEEFKGQYGDCKAAMAEVSEQRAAMDKTAEDQKEGQTALNEQVEAYSAREAEAHKHADALAERESALVKKEDAMKQQELSLQQKDQDLDARQQAVITDEKDSKATRVDKETARKRREEGAAHTHEMQRKHEEMRKQRQDEQAKIAKFKAENAVLHKKVQDLQDEQAKHAKHADKAGYPGSSGADFEKVKLQADLDYAREMLAQQQQRSAQMSSSPAPAPAAASAAPQGSCRSPPDARMPAFGLSPPSSRMPEKAVAFKIAPPQRVVPAQVIEQKGIPTSLSPPAKRQVAKW
ncbi:hypothetical protein LTR53_002070 [Teratosphaeriaceae sp. CCFEE 6253]|nr:hypothetical protein LTR53_002070 [Teratosphaeriaceae sp. CCFEE 6253]